MSVLAALARAYERLPDAPPLGYAPVRIGALVSLRPDGSVASITDLRDTVGRKRQAPEMLVPQAAKRTVAIAPNFLWDKTAYALGLTAGEGKRTAQEHAAFKERHAEWLEGTEDEGLRAFLAFLDGWDSEGVMPQGWSDDLLDVNVAFTLDSERLAGIRLHDRVAARAAWATVAASAGEGALCLVTGRTAPAARLHPSVKGVWGAQSSGASLVSFNLDAFTSYGHAQGDNAPVSEDAAFAYGTALNRFLATDSGHRIQVGDASTVFWADASGAVAREAETLFGGLLGGGPATDDTEQAKKVEDKLVAIREGRPLREVAPELDEGVRFHVLGLAPNAARLSVRFHLDDTFGALASNYQRFLQDVAIDPAPRQPVALWRLLSELAVQGKRENVPPGLAGDWMRAILTGGRYPQALLAAALMRVRADQSVNGLRAGILRAMLTRNEKEEVPMARDIDNEHDAYQLGRLFAILEIAQYKALGKVNASIADRYYASASSTPARVFAPLLRGLRVHISDARKQGKRIGWIEDRVAEIVARLPPDLPTSLRATDQARFAIGYYHEKAYSPAKEADPLTEETEAIE